MVVRYALNDVLRVSRTAEDIQNVEISTTTRRRLQEASLDVDFEVEVATPASLGFSSPEAAAESVAEDLVDSSASGDLEARIAYWASYFGSSFRATVPALDDVPLQWRLVSTLVPTVAPWSSPAPTVSARKKKNDSSNLGRSDLILILVICLLALACVILALAQIVLRRERTTRAVERSAFFGLSYSDGGHAPEPFSMDKQSKGIIPARPSYSPKQNPVFSLAQIDKGDAMDESQDEAPLEHLELDPFILKDHAPDNHGDEDLAAPDSDETRESEEEEVEESDDEPKKRRDNPATNYFAMQEPPAFAGGIQKWR